MTAALQRLECRVALALNNMAVTMMERHCYEQAFLTFQDAVMAIRLAAAASSFNQKHDNIKQQQQQPDEITSHQRLVLESLKRAHQRTSRPEVCRRQLSQQLQYPISLTVVTISHHDSCPLTDDDFVVPTFPSYYLIRLDDVDLIAKGYEDYNNNNANEVLDHYYEDVTLAKMVTLFNYGICSLCVAQSMTNNDTIVNVNQNGNTGDQSLSQSYNIGGRRRLIKCHNMLMAEYDAACTNSSTGSNGRSSSLDRARNVVYLLRLFFLLNMVLKVLGQTLHACGKLKDAQTCFMSLSRLESVVSVVREQAHAGVYLALIGLYASAPAA